MAFWAILFWRSFVGDGCWEYWDTLGLGLFFWVRKLSGMDWIGISEFLFLLVGWEGAHPTESGCIAWGGEATVGLDNVLGV